jgi:hypothetical protein
MADYIDTQGTVYPSGAKLLEKTPTGMLLEVDGEVDGEKLRVDIFRDDVLRLKISQGGVFDERSSCAVCVEAPASSEFTIEETDEHVVLKTSRVHLRVTKVPFSVGAYRADGSTICESYRDEDKGPTGYDCSNVSTPRTCSSSMPAVRAGWLCRGPSVFPISRHSPFSVVAGR